MFEKIKGKRLLKESEKVALIAIETAGKGESFDLVDDIHATYVTGAFFFAIIYRSLKRRTSDEEEIKWIVGNAIMYFGSFFEKYDVNGTRLKEMTALYLEIKDSIKLEADNITLDEMYHELSWEYLNRLFNAHEMNPAEVNLQYVDVAYRMIHPVYEKAIETAMKVKLY